MAQQCSSEGLDKVLVLAASEVSSGCIWKGRGPPGLGSRATHRRREARIRARLLCRHASPALRCDDWISCCGDVVVKVFWEGISEAARNSSKDFILGQHSLHEVCECLCADATSSGHAQPEVSNPEPGGLFFSTESKPCRPTGSRGGREEPRGSGLGLCLRETGAAGVADQEGGTKSKVDHGCKHNKDLTEA